MVKLIFISLVLVLTSCASRSKDHFVHEIQGDIDQAAVASVVKSNLQRVRDCVNIYEPARNLNAQVSIGFRISKQGLAEAIKVESTLIKQNALNCITNHYKTIQFPLPYLEATALIHIPILIKN